MKSPISGSSSLRLVTQDHDLIRPESDRGVGTAIAVGELHFQCPASAEDIYDRANLTAPKVVLGDVIGQRNHFEDLDHVFHRSRQEA